MGTDSRTIDPRLIPDHKLEKSKRIPEKHTLCFIDYAKAFDDGTTLSVSWETCMPVKKQEIEPNIEQWTGSKLGKEYVPITCPMRNLYAAQEARVRTKHRTKDWFQTGKEYAKAVYCYFAYLIYIQSTSCEMPGWMKHKLKSKLQGEISITSHMQMIPSLGQKAKRSWRASRWKWKRRVKKLS